MPHQCTTCGRTFADGSKEMLSGCPDCGGNKFQFAPSQRARGDSGELGDEKPDTDTSSAGETETSGAGKSETSSGTEKSPFKQEETWPQADDASWSQDSAFSEWPDTAKRPTDRSSANSTDGAIQGANEGNTADNEPDGQEVSDSGTEHEQQAVEDTAQANARTAVVSSDELPSHSERVTTTDPETGEKPPEHGRVVSEPSEEQPSIDELRKELNQQFESIKIVRPGEYELNLMELYNREEYIVSLQEDGRYVIDVPDTWRESGN